MSAWGGGIDRRGFLLGGLAAGSLALAGNASGRAASGTTSPATGAAGEGSAKRAPNGSRVIVVGAGLAGLAAAYELDRSGHDVTVLEAQLRPGGRVHTLRLADGLAVEAGAMGWPAAPHVERYFETFGIPARQVGPPAGNTVQHFRGERRVVERRAAPPPFPFDLTDEERAKGLGAMMRDYLFNPARELGDPSAPGFRLEDFAAHDAVTFDRFVADRGASPAARELLSLFLAPGYGWRDGSALHRLASDFALFLAGQGVVRAVEGGSDKVPKAFAAALRDKIHYGAAVARVEQQENAGVTVHFEQGGVPHRLEADRAVLTAPCPAMARIEFDPPLSAAKQRIFKDLEYLPVLRVFVQARRRVWEEAGNAGTASTDLPVGLIAEHPLAPIEDRGPRGALEAHLKGADALAAAALTPDQRLAFVRDAMDKVHPGLAEACEGGVSYDWTADPWAGGGYAWWKPGELTAWLPELARPEGRLHFAGEHTSVLARTVEGAFESGNRAAGEVHAAARNVNP